jgi:hypothetical protein
VSVDYRGLSVDYRGLSVDYRGVGGLPWGRWITVGFLVDDQWTYLINNQHPRDNQPPGADFGCSPAALRPESHSPGMKKVCCFHQATYLASHSHVQDRENPVLQRHPAHHPPPIDGPIPGPPHHPSHHRIGQTSQCPHTIELLPSRHRDHLPPSKGPV